MKTYRMAIVGTGNIAGNHLKAVRDLGERAELVAVVDLNEEALNKFYEKHELDIAAYTDLGAMLAEQKPDLVSISTPPASHKAISIQCMEAGAWVYCEKPLCASLAEFDAITEAEKRTGCYTSTVFQWRYGSAVQHLKKLIEEKALGRSLVAVCDTLWYRPQAYYDVSWRGKYATELGGPTVGLGIHLMDLFLYLMDDWQDVYAYIDTMDRDMEIEDISMAMLRFVDGAKATIINSALSPRQESHLRLDFQKATVEVTALYRYNNENWRFTLPPNVEDADTSALWDTLTDDISGSQSVQLAEIVRCMDANQRPLVSGEEARRIIEFIASLYKSAHSGRPVKKGEITPDDPFYYSNNGAQGAKSSA